MDKCATVAQLLYQLAISEKCKVPHRFSIRYRHKLKSTISHMVLLVDCLMDDHYSSLHQPLCIYIEQNVGKKFPIPSSIFQSWKDQEFMLETSEISTEENRLLSLMKEILHAILVELETRKQGYTQRVFLLIHDFHNLPRPLMDREKKTLWPIEQPPMSVNEAMECCTLLLNK